MPTDDDRSTHAGPNQRYERFLAWADMADEDPQITTRSLSLRNAYQIEVLRQRRPYPASATTNSGAESKAAIRKRRRLNKPALTSRFPILRTLSAYCLGGGIYAARVSRFRRLASPVPRTALPYPASR